MKKEYEKYIIKKLSDNWGLVKGGQISPGNTKNITIPKRSEELAELWGILLGDGHIEKDKAHKKGVYHIKVTGNSILDKDYLLNFVQPLMKKLFCIAPRIRFSKIANAMDVIADSKKIVDYFEKEGFKAGDKIRNQSTIPLWVKKNPKFLAACLRGMYDTDGSFYKLTNQNSYQVCFTNKNKRLLEDARNSILSLGIHCSKISKEKDITITKKSEIAKFYKVIGFSNPKHLNKIKSWNAKFSPV